MKKITNIIILLIIIMAMPISRVNAETKNNNPLLIDLIIDGDTTKLNFDQFVTDYVVATENDTIDIEAVPDDANAHVEIIGDTNLKPGKNDIEIKVTAEDKKTTQIYYLHVTKGETEKANANLKTLEIEEIELNPKFNDKDIYYYAEYNGIIDNLKINAIPESKNAKVEVTGNENLDTGTVHLIKIVVTAEDGITTKTYQINMRQAGENIEDEIGYEPVSNEEENSNQLDMQEQNYKILVVILGIVIICLLIIIILKRKKNK